MKIDVGVSSDFDGSIWHAELAGYIPTPIFAGAADEKLDWAIVCLDRLFLIPPWMEDYLLIPKLGGHSVEFCVEMINEVVLHELFHLCGCGEKEIQNCLHACVRMSFIKNKRY